MVDESKRAGSDAGQLGSGTDSPNGVATGAAAANPSAAAPAPAPARSPSHKRKSFVSFTTCFKLMPVLLFMAFYGGIKTYVAVALSAVALAVLHIRSVPPNRYVVLCDYFSGKYMVKESGLYWCQLWQSPVPNPWEPGVVAWPLQGKHVDFDPDPVSVSCALHRSDGTAKGVCDIRMVVSITRTLNNVDDVSAFLRTVDRRLHANVNSMANEYVRGVCHALSYESCNVKTVYESLMKSKGTLNARIGRYLIQVESFVVENIKFDIDHVKAEQDKKEYQLIRHQQNKLMEEKLIDQECINRLKNARADNAITLEHAKAECEAKTMTQMRLNEVEISQKKAMVELLGQTNYSYVCAMDAVGKALGSNTHLIPPDFLGFTNVTDMIQRHKPGTS